MAIEKYILSATTTGTTGSATGAATTADVVQGRVQAVYLVVPTSGTANVTLASAGTETENIVSFGTVTASAWRYPRRQVHDSAGNLLYTGGTAAAATTGPVADAYVIRDHLTMSVTGATTAITFTMSVFVES